MLCEGYCRCVRSPTTVAFVGIRPSFIRSAIKAYAVDFANENTIPDVPRVDHFIIGSS